MAHENAKRLMVRLREVRKVLGLSQEKFAEKAGLKYKHYQAVEAGRKLNISFTTLEKLARACELELWELLNFEREPAALAEHGAESGFKPATGKGGRKSAKRRPE